MVPMHKVYHSSFISSFPKHHADAQHGTRTPGSAYCCCLLLPTTACTARRGQDLGCLGPPPVRSSHENEHARESYCITTFIYYGIIVVPVRGLACCLLPPM